MTSVAEKTGLGRESLYKAFAPGAKPRYETIIKILSNSTVEKPALIKSTKVCAPILPASPVSEQAASISRSE